jgi:hypothetical protein
MDGNIQRATQNIITMGMSLTLYIKHEGTITVIG